MPGGTRELAAHVVEGLQRRPLGVDVGVLRGQHVAQVHYHRHAPATEVLDCPLQALERMPKIAGSPSEDVVGEVGVLRAADDADAKEARDGLDVHGHKRAIGIRVHGTREARTSRSRGL